MVVVGASMSCAGGCAPGCCPAVCGAAGPSAGCCGWGSCDWAAGWAAAAGVDCPRANCMASAGTKSAQQARKSLRLDGLLSKFNKVTCMILPNRYTLRPEPRQKLLQPGRQRSIDRQRFARPRMGKFQVRRVQEIPVKLQRRPLHWMLTSDLRRGRGDRTRRAVERVPNYGMPQRLH